MLKKDYQKEHNKMFRFYVFVISRLEYCFNLLSALTTSDTLNSVCQIPANERLDCVVCDKLSFKPRFFSPTNAPFY